MVLFLQQEIRALHGDFYFPRLTVLEFCPRAYVSEDVRLNGVPVLLFHSRLKHAPMVLLAVLGYVNREIVPVRLDLKNLEYEIPEFIKTHKRILRFELLSGSECLINYQFQYESLVVNLSEVQSVVFEK